MLLSRNLLNKINPNFSKITNADLSAGLNAIGIEVENVHCINVNPNLKLGRLISFKPHPNSDHLNICDVVVDDKKIQIVCGANNLQQNQWVVVALPGIELNGIILENREIRGVWSYGMLCSIGEILDNSAPFLSDEDSKTIIQIPYSLKLSPKTFFNDFGFNDIVFDLSIPSNRPELNGLYFLAHELNLQFNFNTKLPKSSCILNLKGLFSNKTHYPAISFNLPFKLAYNLLHLKLNTNIELLWKLKLTLIHSGIKVKGNYSDFGSLITMLFAQPTVCISQKLAGDHLYISELTEPTQFTTTDNKTLTLQKGTIVTRNTSNEIVSVTGMYLAKSYVANFKYNDVYLEMANFSSEYILDSNKKNNFNDSVVNYFLKNPANNVSTIAVQWLKNYHKNILDKTVTNLLPIKTTNFEWNKPIYFNMVKFWKILGVKLNIKQLLYIFKKIGIIFLGYKVLVPAYRKDLNNITDLVEEVLKYLDINKLALKPIHFQVQDFRQNKYYTNLTNIRTYLVNKQFYETKTYNLTNQESLELYNWFEIKDNIEIKNALSKDRKFLRKNLVHEMLNVLAYNTQHKQQLVNIFEIQKIHFNNENANDFLCCISSVPMFTNPLDHSILHMDDYTNKAIYESLETAIGFKLRKKYNVTHFTNLYNINNFALYNKDNKLVGVVGRIQDSVLKQVYKINHPVYVICLNLDLALSNLGMQHNFWKISEFNPIYKDITFSNPNNIDLKDITRNLLDLQLVTSVQLNDVFVKDNVKSYNITIKIQPTNKNLTTTEINELFTSAIQILRTAKLVVKDQ